MITEMMRYFSANITHATHIGTDYGALLFFIASLPVMYKVTKNEHLNLLAKILLWCDLLFIATLYFIYDFYGLGASSHEWMATAFNCAGCFHVINILYLGTQCGRGKHRKDSE